jgi:hypothetical protein
MPQATQSHQEKLIHLQQTTNMAHKHQHYHKHNKVSSEVIEVEAPANLSEGYTFYVDFNGRTFPVVVPKGGVLEGEVFDALVPPLEHMVAVTASTSTKHDAPLQTEGRPKGNERYPSYEDSGEKYDSHEDVGNDYDNEEPEINVSPMPDMAPTPQSYPPTIITKTTVITEETMYSDGTISKKTTTLSLPPEHIATLTKESTNVPTNASSTVSKQNGGINGKSIAQSRPPQDVMKTNSVDPKKKVVYVDVPEGEWRNGLFDCFGICCNGTFSFAALSFVIYIPRLSQTTFCIYLFNTQECSGKPGVALISH